MKRRSIRLRRLELRSYRMVDYASWFDAHVNSPSRKSKYDQDPIEQTKASKTHFKELIQRHKDREKADQVYVWGVFELRTGELVGMLDIAILDRRKIQKGNLGYRVFNRHWRKGFGKEFVAAGIGLGLKDLKLNRLEAVIDLDNRASIALVRSVGMKKEGIRTDYWYQDGKWEDQVVFVATRADWGLPKLHPDDL